MKTIHQLDEELIKGLEGNCERWAKWVIRLMTAGEAMEYYLTYFNSPKARAVKEAWQEAKEWPMENRQ